MAKRRKKTIFLGLVLAVLLIGSAAVYFGGTWYLKRRADGWKQQGIAAAKAGDDATASQLLLRYLRRHPDDTEALTYYVNSRERTPMADGQQYAETIAALKLLIQQRPANIDDRLHLLELYAKLERIPEALDVANAILAKSPNQLRTLELKTQLLTLAGQDREGLETARHWAEVSPEDLAPQLARLGLEFHLERQPAEIIAEATRLRESHPGSADFEVLQGFAFAHAGDDEQARKWLKTAAAHPDLSPGTAKILVEQLDGCGMSDDALAVLKDLVKRDPASDMKQGLARRMWELARWQDTVDLLQSLDPADSKTDPTLLAFKCISLSNLGRTTDSKTCRAAINNRIDPAAHAWSLLLQRMLDGTTVDDQKIAAACHLAISSDPLNSYIAFYMGEADLRLGELDLAIDAFRHSAAMNSSWSLPALQLVECLMQKGKPEQAVDVASYCARRHPNDAASVITLARAWAAGVDSGGVGQSADLLKLVNEVQKQIPGEDRTLLIQIQLLAEQKKIDEATRIARAAITRVPPPGEDVFRITTLLSAKYSLGLEADCYRSWEHALGITPALAYARAVDQCTAGHADAGLALFDDLSQKGTRSNPMQWQLARALYLDLTGNPSAKAAWTSLRDQYPNQMVVQDSAVHARSVQGDWAFLTPVIDNLHKLSGDDGLAWRLAHASLMVESPRSEDDYEKGSIELNKLIERYPSLPEPHLLLARALVHMRRIDGAIQHLTTASKLDPTSVPTALELSALLQSQGDFERVEQELDRVTPQLRTSEQRQQAAQLLARQNNPDRAIQILQATTKPTDADSIEQKTKQQLLLAMLYRQRHEDGRADAIIRKLMLQPDLATIQFAASLFLSERLPADARAALEQLDNLKLEPGMKDAAWGWYYARTGDLTHAIESYRKAASAAPQATVAWRELAIAQLSIGKPADAATTLNQACQAQPGNQEFTSLKPHVSDLTAAGADPKLLPIVVEVLRNPSSDPPLLELLQILQERTRTGGAEHCAASLQTLCEHHPECMAARTQLVQCYLDMDRRAEAVSAAQRMMAAFPKDPQPAQVATEACRIAGRWREMATAAQNWKDRQPDAAESADCAIADAEIHLQQSSVALTLLQPYMNAASANPDQHVQVLTLFALASSTVGDSSAASDILWPLASKSSTWRRLWLSVALQLPDGTVASNWLERAVAIIPHDALRERVSLGEAFNLLGQRLKDAALVSRASEICDQAGNDPGADVPALMAAGAQAERTGRLNDAELFYQRAIAMDSSAWVAENNLAMLIINRGGDLNKAEQLAESAVKLRPLDPQLQDTLATVLDKAGNPQRATLCMRTAIRLDPDNVLWRIRLGQYLLAAGDRSGASQTVAELDGDLPALNQQPAQVQAQFQALRDAINGKSVKF